MHTYTKPIQRMALAVPEQRVELGISRSELARLSGVSRSTISKLDAGRPVDPKLVVDLASTLMTLEVWDSFRPDPVVPAEADLQPLFEMGDI